MTVFVLGVKEATDAESYPVLTLLIDPCRGIDWMSRVVGNVEVVSEKIAELWLQTFAFGLETWQPAHLAWPLKRSRQHFSLVLKITVCCRNRSYLELNGLIACEAS